MNRESFEFLSKRVQCPKCGSTRGFAPFKDVEGGYCHSCGATIFPDNFQSKERRKIPGKKKIETVQRFIDKAIVDGLPKFEKSVFAEYFGNLFGDGFIWHCENCFDVRSDKYRATVFIYRNYNGNFINAKSIHYQTNGKRDKQGFEVLINNEIVYFPAVFGYRTGKDGEFDKIEFFSKSKGYKQCLFNEYFLNPTNIPFSSYDLEIDYNENTPVILLESEKSVLIASYFFPEYIYIATGGVNGLTPDKAEKLKGRRVFICYDSGTSEGSKKTFKLLNEIGIKAKIINLFEDCNVPAGFDVADSVEFFFKGGKLRT